MSEVKLKFEQKCIFLKTETIFFFLNSDMLYM